MIKFTYSKLEKYFTADELTAKKESTTNFIKQLKSNPMAGWLDLPVDYDKEEFARIKAAAKQINQDSKYLVCIGVGGSYLGHKAVVAALGRTSKTKTLYAGNSFSPIELNKILAKLGDADFSINFISKSGTTTEAAVAFRVFKQKLIEKYGETAAYKRIYATTNPSTAALYDEAVANNYARFVVPDSLGDRYAMFAPTCLLPLAVAGIDLDEFIQGAALEREALLSANGGDAAVYAAVRNNLYAKDFHIEILANFEPSFMYFNEWWKQLVGESEGKEGKGIFPAAVINTTDLHSMGQYIQEGRRNFIETVMRFATLPSDHQVPPASSNLDNLDYLQGKSLSWINQQAIKATIEAHRAGGVPVLEIEVPDISAKSLGALTYFFQLGIAFSGLLSGIDPFNQPGVEAYKANMFRLLGKPGH